MQNIWLCYWSFFTDGTTKCCQKIKFILNRLIKPWTIETFQVILWTESVHDKFFLTKLSKLRVFEMKRIEGLELKFFCWHHSTMKLWNTSNYFLDQKISIKAIQQKKWKTSGCFMEQITWQKFEVFSRKLYQQLNVEIFQVILWKETSCRKGINLRFSI